MTPLSQTIFVVLKGASYGFPTLVVAGFAAFFAYALFSRGRFKYTALWGGMAAMLFLGGMLYFDDGQVLIQLSSHAANTGPAAPGMDESDIWFDFIAKAISGVIGIFAGLKFRMRFWPTANDVVDPQRSA